MPVWSNFDQEKAKKLAGHSLYTLGSGLCTAGAAVAKAAAAGISTLTLDRNDKERVLWANIREIEWHDSAKGTTFRHHVCLLGYETGFQLWTLDERSYPSELVSLRRDGAVRWLEPVPQPLLEDPRDGPLHDTRPLVAVVPAASSHTLTQLSAHPQHRVEFYSLRSQSYVKTLHFRSEVQAVLCSRRAVVVALHGQLQAFDAVTLEHSLSCMTYCPPTSRQPTAAPTQQPGAGQHSQEDLYLPLPGAPCALGQRWLAYAADQVVQHSVHLAKAQRLPLHSKGSAEGVVHSLAAAAEGPSGASISGSPSVNGTLSHAAMRDVAKDYAVKSGQQLAGMAAAAGSASYKYLSSHYRQWRSGAQQGAVPHQVDSSVGGTVMVRDVVTRQVVCHFRAHGVAISTMQFTPDGTILATASVNGHSVNVFRIIPPRHAPSDGTEGEGSLGASGGGGGEGDGSGGYAVHLFKLYRGVTPSVIQAISFASDSSWVAVTSQRGTNHVFHLAGAGGAGRGGSRLPLLLPDGHPAAADGGQWDVERDWRGGSQGRGSLDSVVGGPGEGAAATAASLTLEEGVTGQPVKLYAAGRAGGPTGLLGSGVAGAATQAARSVYGQPSAVLPSAAAFVPSKPPSPRGMGAGGATTGHAPLGAYETPISLMLVNWEGQLTQHALSLLPGGAVPSAAPAVNGQYVNGWRDSPRSEQHRPVATLREEARWDICRQHEWQEREAVPACLIRPALPLPHAKVLLEPQSAPAATPPAATGREAGAWEGGATADGELADGGDGGGQGERGSGTCPAVPAPDPAWLSQAETGAEVEAALGRPPLWADPQFRFHPLPAQQLSGLHTHPQQQL